MVRQQQATHVNDPVRMIIRVHTDGVMFKKMEKRVEFPINPNSGIYGGSINRLKPPARGTRL